MFKGIEDVIVKTCMLAEGDVIASMSRLGGRERGREGVRKKGEMEREEYMGECACVHTFLTFSLLPLPPLP